jgi:hypothetical protein
VLVPRSVIMDDYSSHCIGGQAKELKRRRDSSAAALGWNGSKAQDGKGARFSSDSAGRSQATNRAEFGLLRCRLMRVQTILFADDGIYRAPVRLTRRGSSVRLFNHSATVQLSTRFICRCAWR